MFEDDKSSENDFRGFNTHPVSDILDLVTHLEKVSEEEVQAWVDVDKSIPITLSLDNDEIIEYVLRKEKDDEEEDEDEDDGMQTKKVTWKLAYEGLQTFTRLAEQCSSMSAHDVMKLDCIHSEFVKLRQQSMTCRQTLKLMLCHHTNKFTAIM